MEIFRRLNKLRYKHYLDYTVEELDNLDIKSKEFNIEANLAFDWFREKHKLESHIKSGYVNKENVGYYFGIDDYTSKDFYSDYYKTYQQAQLACLEKLIEIIELKQKEDETN